MEERCAHRRTLLLILFGTGATFGATEVGVGVTAAAHALGSTTTAGPLLGLWGLGSLLGGIASRLGGGASGPRGLILLLAALALTHGALILTTGSTIAIAVVMTLAGATIAPTVSSIYAMVDAAAPAGLTPRRTHGSSPLPWSVAHLATAQPEPWPGALAQPLRSRSSWPLAVWRS